MIVQLIGTGVIPLSPDEMWCSYTLCTGTYIYDVIAINVYYFVFQIQML